MRTLPKLLCAITLLSMSGFVWASCPEGYTENDRTGECKAIPGWAGGAEEKKLKAAIASVAPGKFEKYGPTWITAPMNTEEAVEYYFKGRQLDTIEGIWESDGPKEEIVIVKNTFGLSSDMEYLGIISESHGDPKDMPAGLVIQIFDQKGDSDLYYFTGLVSSSLWASESKIEWHDHVLQVALSDGERTLTFRRNYISKFNKWMPDFLLSVKVYPQRNSEQVAGSGTGFFVSSDGYVVTNHHVIKGADKITVTTPSGESFEAIVESISTSTDLALLRIPYQTKNYLTFASPGSTDIGHQVFTLGYPVSDMLGKEVKYTDGSISSLSGLQGDATFFQISVPIQPGNSGGPLVNADGDVVGVVTATAAVEAFYASVGVMPQNVNWAVKGAYASLLLPPTMEMSERPKSNPIANAKWSVVFIETE